MRKPMTFLARLRAIPTDGMSDNDLLSHRILEKQLEREDVNYALKNYEMPVNQQNGCAHSARRFAERGAV
jgi:hypothetical protein